ncbi:MAG: ABC transporter ATP-binding protein [Planctomycetes bacterium]|nr:ABC transporter ATP-binding protein [Planctomycetota bacterium]
MPESILELVGVTRTFGGVVAVNDLSLSVPLNGITGLIGPNGAGKTTVFNVVSGFYQPQKGKILFKGRDITSLPPHRVCRLGIARTFQNIRLFSRGTALENVMVGCHVRRRKQWWMPLLHWPGINREEREIREHSLELIRKLGLESYAEKKALSLPYGAQRRLEIARALATRPEFLLLDEPAAGMNPQESVDLMHFIRRVRDEFNLTILLIEHDMKVVMGICEHIWVLDYGSLIAEGTAEEIRYDPKVVEAYLGVGMEEAPC